MHKVNKGFYVGVFLAGRLGYWIFWEVTRFLGMVYPHHRPTQHILNMSASLLSILSGVVTFILIYKMWAAIQGRGARTSAGKALGFMFIPLFNFYWFFEVYWGWTKDYNRIPESDDVELPLMPEGIALAVCVLPLLSMCVMIASFFGGGWENFAEEAAVNVVFQASMLMSLVNTILMALLFNKICDGINALVDAGLEPLKPQYVLPAEDAKTSGMAIASLVLGICGLCTVGLAAIAGLILGIVSLSAIRKSQGWLKGTGLAIAGIAVSGMILLTTSIMMAMIFPALAKERVPAKQVISISNARHICMSMMMYCDENDGSFPPVDNWPDVLEPYIRKEKVLTSPFAPEAGRAWALNENLDGWKITDINHPHRTVLIFESRFNSPPAGGRELMPESPRTRRGYVIGFVDGHAEYVRHERLDELIWTPETQPSEIVR